MRFFRAFALFGRIAKNFVVTSKLDQHQRLLPLQRRRRAAEPRHVVEQPFGAGQQFQRRGARHVVFFRLRDGGSDDICRAPQRRLQEGLVGLELLQRIGGAARGGDREQRERGDDRVADIGTAPPRTLGAAEHVVSRPVEQPRDHLRDRQIEPVAALAHIGGQFVVWRVGHRAVGTDHEAQRRREAFAARIARRAVDDHGNHGAVRMPRLEQADFLVDVVALGRDRRAQHDERARCAQRRKRLLGQRVPGGEVLAVAKNRPQRRRHGTLRSRASGQILVDAEVFQSAMQAPRPSCVGMGVGQERAIFERNRLSHGRDSECKARLSPRGRTDSMISTACEKK